MNNQTAATPAAKPLNPKHQELLEQIEQGLLGSDDAERVFFRGRHFDQDAALLISAALKERERFCRVTQDSNAAQGRESEAQAWGAMADRWQTAFTNVYEQVKLDAPAEDEQIYFIELDIVAEEGVEPAADDNHLQFELVDPSGPGGGNPIYRFWGKKADIINYLRDCYGEDEPEKFFEGYAEEFSPAF